MPFRGFEVNSYDTVSAIGKLYFARTLNTIGTSVNQPQDENHRNSTNDCGAEPFLNYVYMSLANKSAENKPHTTGGNKYCVWPLQSPLIRPFFNKVAKIWKRRTSATNEKSQDNTQTNECDCTCNATRDYPSKLL